MLIKAGEYHFFQMYFIMNPIQSRFDMNLKMSSFLGAYGTLWFGSDAEHGLYCYMQLPFISLSF